MPNLMRSNRIFIKVIWSIFIIISVCYCSLFVKSNINSYLQWDVFTKTKIIYKDDLNLPALTICSTYNNHKSIDYFLFYCKFNNIHSCYGSNFEKLEIFDAKRFR